jgi:starvation-inducible DNA-binding protein
VQAHLGALDMAYDGVIGGHRDAITETEALDVVTNDLLIGQAATLEQYQWLVRAHLENTSGELATHGADTALVAAAQAAAADPLQ